MTIRLNKVFENSSKAIPRPTITYGYIKIVRGQKNNIDIIFTKQRPITNWRYWIL